MIPNVVVYKKFIIITVDSVELLLIFDLIVIEDLT